MHWFPESSCVREAPPVPTGARYDFDPHVLADFRVWLQTVYGSLDALNREWETSFASWDDVHPFDTYEIKDRERAALARRQT
jgi:Beta-galactosidase